MKCYWFSLLVVLTAVSLPASAQSTAITSQIDRASGIGGPEVNQTVVNADAPVSFTGGDGYGSGSTYGAAAFGVVRSSATASATEEIYGRYFARSQVTA